MAILSSSDLDDVPHQVLWQDGECVFCRTWRIGAGGERQEFIIVRSAVEHPTPGTIARLTHEYELRNHLERASASSMPTVTSANKLRDPPRRRRGAPRSSRDC
jgi:hypothetical protein